MPAAVVATAFGGPDVLELVEVASVAPGPGEVRVRVRAAAVNPFDHKRYSGTMGADPSRLPMRLGLEAAGEVLEVGPDAVGPAGPVAVGDAVLVHPVDGGYATELTVPADSVVPKPGRLSWEEACGLLGTGVTAFHALTVVRPGAGDTLVVHGVAGGVGLAVAQLALADGVTVVGTAGAGRHDGLRARGVVPVAYGPGLVDRLRAAAPGGVDAAVDTVGTDEAVDTSLQLVAARDRIVSIAAWGRADSGITLIGGGPGADPGTQVRRAARLDLVRRAEAGTLTVRVAASFPLTRAADAHRLVAGGHAGGKVVLVP
jgi:NADPH:quinone reductase-like Zn-dependent oxidoreductase